MGGFEREDLENQHVERALRDGETRRRHLYLNLLPLSIHLIEHTSWIGRRSRYRSSRAAKQTVCGRSRDAPAIVLWSDHTRLFHRQFVEWLPRNADLLAKRFAPVTVLTINA